MFDWVARHWKAIAVTTAAIVVGVGLTIATGGLLGVPALVALGGGIVGGGGGAAALATAVGAVGSALAAYFLGNTLDDRPSTLKGALGSVALNVALSFALLGVFRLAEPVLANVMTPLV